MSQSDIAGGSLLRNKKVTATKLGLISFSKSIIQLDSLPLCLGKPMLFVTHIMKTIQHVITAALVQMQSSLVSFVPAHFFWFPLHSHLRLEAESRRETFCG